MMSLSWLPSTFWFIMSGTFASMLMVFFVLPLLERSRTPTGKEFVWIIMLVFLTFATLACGFRAPDKINVIDVQDDKIQAIVEKAVEARVKELSMKYKYELIAK